MLWISESKFFDLSVQAWHLLDPPAAIHQAVELLYSPSIVYFVENENWTFCLNNVWLVKVNLELSGKFDLLHFIFTIRLVRKQSALLFMAQRVGEVLNGALHWYGVLWTFNTTVIHELVDQLEAYHFSLLEVRDSNGHCAERDESAMANVTATCHGAQVSLVSILIVWWLG